MKTEFLVQLDGAGTKAKDIILVVGMVASSEHFQQYCGSNTLLLVLQVQQTDLKSLMKQHVDDLSSACTFRSHRSRPDLI
ncbi:unnamed protein product [Phytophthora lilii]|uniref:Unnamed protein product n=1 Tax=Phytophthora lilii TaxID=2077276 RepID=A0A9W6U2M6_9STRA|nr:unnamed protein product [Phytophthora lilii]